MRGALIRGILPDAEEQVADLGAHMRMGKLESLKPGEFDDWLKTGDLCVFRRCRSLIPI